MTNSRLLPFLVAISFLFVSQPVWGVEEQLPPAAGQQSVASGIANAEALIAERRFEEALTVLLPLVEANVAGSQVNQDVLFLIGLAALGVAQDPEITEAERETFLDQAIAVFRAILVRNPGLTRVRLELGRAFFLKEEDTLATSNFELAIADNPPAPVVANVNLFLAQIRARRRWSFRAGMAIAPDSNIGLGSEEQIIYINGLPFRRDQEQLTTSGVGVAAWAGGEYQYPLSELWRLRAGGDIWRHEYESGDFDRLSLSGHVGPRWLINPVTEASVLGVARRHWFGNEPFFRDLGARIEIWRRVTQRMTVTLRASWIDRRYDELTHLQGPTMDASVGAAYVLTPTVRMDAALGWWRERAESEPWRNTARWARVGVSVALPLGFTVGGSSTLRWTDYDGDGFPFTMAGESRSDLIRNFRLSVYNRSITLGGFSPQISVVREVRTTNAQLYDYARTYGELSLVRLF